MLIMTFFISTAIAHSISETLLKADVIIGIDNMHIYEATNGTLHLTDPYQTNDTFTISPVKNDHFHIFLNDKKICFNGKETAVTICNKAKPNCDIWLFKSVGKHFKIYSDTAGKNKYCLTNRSNSIYATLCIEGNRNQLFDIKSGYIPEDMGEDDHSMCDAPDTYKREPLYTKSGKKYHIKRIILNEDSEVDEISSDLSDTYNDISYGSDTNYDNSIQSSIQPSKQPQQTVYVQPAPVYVTASSEPDVKYQYNTPVSQNTIPQSRSTHKRASLKVISTTTSYVTETVSYSPYAQPTSNVNGTSPNVGYNMQQPYDGQAYNADQSQVQNIAQQGYVDNQPFSSALQQTLQNVSASIPLSSSNASISCSLAAYDGVGPSMVIDGTTFVTTISSPPNINRVTETVTVYSTQAYSDQYGHLGVEIVQDVNGIYYVKGNVPSCGNSNRYSIYCH